jgi:hypothetical protein
MITIMHYFGVEYQKHFIMFSEGGAGWGNAKG